MHELSIAMSLIDVAEEQAMALRSRVVSIRLRLGPLSGVVKEALLGSFEMAREGSLLATAALVIEEMPIVAFCDVCACSRVIPSMQEMACPVCRTPATKITGGRELEVSALEIVADDAQTGSDDRSGQSPATNDIPHRAEPAG